MHNFAAISPTELVPILGIVAGMLVAFYALIKFVLKQAEKDRDADRNERQALVAAIEDMAASNREIADKTDKMADAAIKGNAEAEIRNGHLAEISENGTKKILGAIHHIKEQKVDHQTVNNETVMNKGE